MTVWTPTMAREPWWARLAADVAVIEYHYRRAVTTIIREALSDR